MSDRSTAMVRADLLQRMARLQTTFPSRAAKPAADETAHQAENTASPVDNGTNPTVLAG